ncbi:hypothetical protein GWO43_29070 [candidate division KSB1 bacterium]|nr:hypothetical protein [candidate division KSB1 bacterium]NIR71576.1 hypothetical protein [candidate division KSB1 bacterium]NIS27958.1 hypothetical protein [candidate division KSB1 bacterium]NIT74839.1 hypothetical protein [candidate division KSB1 bacterium]NIU28615.1 hypothetical protein [candidate division KSB1 bacterium]
MEFLAAALNDDGEETNRIFGTVNGNLNLNSTIESSSIAVGTRLRHNLGVGLVYDNFNGEMNFESTFLPEGIVSSTGGDTRAFNDPARVQYDSLFARARGDWEGNAFRFRLGIGYQPAPNVSLDAVVSTPFTIDLRGPFSMIHNRIRALNLGAACNEESLDPDILLEDDLTKTQRRETSVSGLDIEVPGQLALGFSTRWSNYVASLVFARYFDDLAYSLSYEQEFEEVDSLGQTQQKAERGDIHQGINLGTTVRLGIGVEQLMVGLGVVLAETFREENLNTAGEEPDISDRDKLLLPYFSLGGGVNISSRFRLDYVVNLYNSSFLRFSTSYILN